MKKWLLSLAVTAGVLGLTACTDSGKSEVVVETKAGDITKDELYNTLKDRFGEQVIQELVYQKVLEDKYKVTDKELDERVNQFKADLGENFEMALSQYGYENEKQFKESLKIGMLQEKAALKGVKASEKEMKERYEEIRPEIRARHILVADLKTAQEVKKKLDAGGKFEDLAKQYSTDPGSKEKGGDLDWFGPGAMVPAFEEAAYALEKNEISEPVQSEHGYHIIQVTDKKEKKPYDEMKKQLEYEVKSAKIDQEKVNKAVDKELKAANVEIKDKDLEKALDRPEQPAAQ
ncbi:peptidylprolyl isomerase [Peribacillus saganii]|uniref:Foldase protein PrsA n=1 Tax=Peribacillus saganii TaxID=2303992 RepID=A0A372LFT4_9BACI|nr:peptidylprolyl isomerase [Peribacillus saganii]RFU64405.1 peptidylprolyl isomerase [Peribacillus saganii]